MQRAVRWTRDTQQAHASSATQTEGLPAARQPTKEWKPARTGVEHLDGARQRHLLAAKRKTKDRARISIDPRMQTHGSSVSRRVQREHEGAAGRRSELRRGRGARATSEDGHDGNNALPITHGTGQQNTSNQRRRKARRTHPTSGSSTLTSSAASRPPDLSKSYLLHCEPTWERTPNKRSQSTDRGKSSW